MRIVFMGTPDFAVATLQRLADSRHEIAAVYSQPDKPKGRGHKMQPTPVKEFALTRGFPVLQPLSFKDSQAVEELRTLNPDCLVVVAYGRILPKAVLEIPKLGCINVHGSLLPKYRGAAPIQWAVLNGDAVTGITTMYMAEGMDTGDMLLKAETPIGPEETADQLFGRLKEIGADLLLKTLDHLEAGTLKPEKQREEDVTLAPMITKEMYRIDWSRDAEEIRNQIRGLNFATTDYAGKRMKLFSARVVEASGEPGTLFTRDGSLCVYCGKKALQIVELQPENGKRMVSESYLLGHSLEENANFDS